MAKRKLNETDEPSIVTEPQTQKKTKKSSTEKKEKKEKKSKSQDVKPQEEEPETQEEQQQTEEEQQLEQQLKDEQKQQDEKDEKKKSQKDQKKDQKDDAELTFSDLGLDPRLVQAVAKQSFEKPTLVQRKAIPLALAGQDVLCKAKTGSGKTAAYVLPVLSGILKRKAVS